MVDLGNRQILDDGTVICAESAAVDILYQGKDLSQVLLESHEIASHFNQANHLLDMGFEFLNSGREPLYTDMDWFSAWLIPSEYSDIDVESHCLDRCTTDEQRDRVRYEMMLFRDRNMIPVLRHLIHMVDDMRKRKILWGVGRGSSVSSYVLYLIGINRIDPLEFGLDVREFLK